MAKYSKLRNLTLIIFAVLLICTITVPAAAEPIDEVESKIIFDTDGRMYSFKLAYMEHKPYFDKIKDGDHLKVSRDKDGIPVILLDDSGSKNTARCLPIPCVNGLAPIAGAAATAAFGAEIALEDIAITIAGVTIAATFTDPSIIDNAEAIKISGKVFEKTGEFFQEAIDCAKNSLMAQHLIQYEFYTIDDLDNYDFFKLGRKYKETHKLSSVDALELMKDCDPKENKKPAVIGSTEEGCQRLAYMATAILGGHNIETHIGKKAHPNHFHAGRVDENGKYSHCKSHCYWNYKDFYDIHGRGGGGGSLA